MSKALGVKTLKHLIGKKVWVIQFDDEENSVIGVVEDIDDAFIALRMEHEEEPTLYVSLRNVKEIEVYRTSGDSTARVIRIHPSGSDSTDPGATERS